VAIESAPVAPVADAGPVDDPAAEEPVSIVAVPAAEATPVAPQLAEPEPVLEAAPVTESVIENAPPAEPVEATPVVSPEPVLEAAPVTESVIESAPPAEPVEATAVVSPEPVLEAAPATESVVESAPPAEPVEAEPEPVLEAAPVTESVIESAPPAGPVEATPVVPPEPVLEAAPIIESVIESAPPAEPVEATPVVPPEPALEAAPIIESVTESAPPDEPVEATPAVQQLAEPEPVLEAAPIIESVIESAPPGEPVEGTPVVPPEPVPEIAPVTESIINSAPPAEQVEATPVVPPKPVLKPAPVSESEPVVAAAPAPESEPKQAEAQETPIKLHDVPDPLLALAEEIRAAQNARAAALAQPPSTGLLELAEAVRHQEQTEPAQVSQSTAPVVAPTEKTHVAEEAAAFEQVTAVALLAPPEPIAQEPVSFHELRPAALAPEQPPAAEPEPQPFALVESEAQPAAPAPEPEPDDAYSPMLPFAPMQEYKPATSRSIMPVPPRAQILGAEPGPRITLPGPTLPPELTRLHEANVVTVMGEATAQRTKEALPPPKSGGAPGWLVSGFVMLLLLAAGLGVVFYLLPHTVADAKPAPTPAVAATTPAPTGGNSPLAKFVEVTGFRIVTSSAEAGKKDAVKKSEVQYLIVNHSDADISDANVFVTLRGVKPGLPPLCRFSFKVPSLGPFESKEMSSPIGNSTRAVSLPDWQEIRAEVQISQ
jgi:hypothetical protein